jgi:hypothetical protein
VRENIIINRILILIIILLVSISLVFRNEVALILTLSSTFIIFVCSYFYNKNKSTILLSLYFLLEFISKLFIDGFRNTDLIFIGALFLLLSQASIMLYIFNHILTEKQKEIDPYIRSMSMILPLLVVSLISGELILIYLFFISITLFIVNLIYLFIMKKTNYFFLIGMILFGINLVFEGLNYIHVYNLYHNLVSNFNNDVSLIIISITYPFGNLLIYLSSAELFFKKQLKVINTL